MKENKNGEDATDRIRKAGGGRKPVKEKHPEILKVIETVVSDATFGNPENPLTYTTKSTGKIKQIAHGKGYGISHTVAADILEALGYSLGSLTGRCRKRERRTRTGTPGSSLSTAKRSGS